MPSVPDGVQHMQDGLPLSAGLPSRSRLWTTGSVRHHHARALTVGLGGGGQARRVTATQTS